MSLLSVIGNEEPKLRYFKAHIKPYILLMNSVNQNQNTIDPWGELGSVAVAPNNNKKNVLENVKNM